MSSRFLVTGPWDQPLDWDMQASGWGEAYLPFHRSVQPEPDSNSLEIRGTVQLPVELQLNLLQFCNRATLFRFMHVSSTLRKEAQKLFWSDAAWYLSPGHFLLSEGYAGHTDYDTTALAQMRQVELRFGMTLPLGNFKWNDSREEYQRRPTGKAKELQIQQFWQTFQRIHPHATRVVLSADLLAERCREAPERLTAVAEACPAHVSVFVSTAEQEEGCESALARVLYQQQEGVWELTDAHWSRLSVIPPLKAFHGPVGRFCHLNYIWKYYNHLDDARYRLLVYAIGRHYAQHKQEPCLCPADDCGLAFESPDQWALHAADSVHWRGLVAPTEQLQVLFNAHDAKIALVRQRWRDMLDHLRQQRGVENSEQRKEIDDAFLNQLSHDPEYRQGKPVRESDIWLNYVETMNEEES